MSVQIEIGIDIGGTFTDAACRYPDGRLRGGYGDPARRERAAVARDLADGKVSVENAKDVYAWTWLS